MDNTSPASTFAARLKRASTIIGPVVSILALCVALWFLERELAGLSREAIFGYIRAMPTLSLVSAMGLAACSYAILTGYDAVALKHLDKAIPYRRSALTAFMAYAVGHNVGFAALSGGSIRYRMYTLAGLSATEIARVIVFVTATFGLGASGLSGLALILMPGPLATVVNLPSPVLTAIGVLLLALPFIYLAGSFFRRTPLKVAHWQLALPRPTIALTQVGLSVADLVCAAATLYVLLDPILHTTFLAFLGVFLLAMAAGLISSIPGGVGVFEAVMVAAFPGVDPVALLGTMIIFRLIYYVAPLALALTLLAGHESAQHRSAIKRSTETALGWLTGIAPQVVAIAVFLAGLVLLVSGASPSIDTRLDLVKEVIPLPILELSHLAGSVTGVGLLILARGLHSRLRGAFLATVLALSAGIGMSLLKGLDYEEALLLGGILLVLWLSRDEFYRQGAVATQQFSAPRVASIVVVLCLASWVGYIGFRNVDYSHNLWWQFAFEAEASRMLRASFFAAVTVLGFVLWRMLRTPARPSPPIPAADEAEHIRQLLLTATEASANVALLGDKQFLWSDDRQAFIMYQVSGDSWIAFGDPVGPTDHHEELAWAFRELVDRHDGRVVFYQVSDHSLALYVDLGLSLAKLGEDARVSLTNFTLEGSHRADLRQARNRATKNGASFDIVPRSLVPSITANLRRVSDSWLTDK